MSEALTEKQAERPDIKRLLDPVRRMDDLFVRCDPALRSAEDAPYSDEEWDTLRIALRRALPEPSTQPGRSRLLILA